MTDYKKLADRLYPNLPATAEAIESKYPARQMPEGSMVTRVAPSPTGFMHLGHLLVALVDERLARQTDGIFYLRIEDTDQKREIDGAAKVIIDSLKRYDLVPDEGEITEGKEIGNYGPYKQSNRLDFYHAFAKRLVEQGLAYPCFVTTEELEKISAEQEAQKIRPGYRGQWAIWRDKTEEEIYTALDAGKPFVLRFRSEGNFENKIKIFDLIRGDREMSENDLDLILLKSDGYPTYHFAHIVDDHLMGTTAVFRADEWLSSLPTHLQLFKAFGWTAPQYGHLAPIQKIDKDVRRKLSKRKDPEANVQFYTDTGYPAEAVVEYLLNLLNSNFEDWRKANPTADNREFKLEVKKFNTSGALFDPVKLDDVSRNIIAAWPAERVYEEISVWAKTYDLGLAKVLEDNKNYTLAVLGIERGVVGGRKDIAKWADVRQEIGYFFDDIFALTEQEAREWLDGIKWEDVKTAVEKMLTTYNPEDDKDVWFGKIKEIAVSMGYADSGKAFKLEPEKYKGQVGDIAKIFRVLLTGRVISPDLHQVMRVLGRERVEGRLRKVV